MTEPPLSFGDTVSQADEQRRLAGPRRSRVRGMLLRGAAAISFVLAALLTTVAAIAVKALLGDSTVAAWVGYVVTAVVASTVAGLLSWYGARLRARGHRHVSRDASTILHRDRRQPVLYLRPFAMDPAMAIPRFKLLRAPMFSSSRTEEEELVEALRAIGPVITVGQPGEWAPHLGAARLYIPEDWRQTVLHLVRTARLVVLAAGYGEGFLWELRQTLAVRPPTSIVILILHGPADYAQLRDQLRPFFPRPLPDYPPGKPTVEWAIKGAVYFDSYWTPYFVRFDMVPGPGSRRTNLAWCIVRSLRPVYERFNVMDPVPRRS